MTLPDITSSLYRVLSTDTFSPMLVSAFSASACALFVRSGTVRAWAEPMDSVYPILVFVLTVDPAAVSWLAICPAAYSSELVSPRYLYPRLLSRRIFWASFSVLPRRSGTLTVPAVRSMLTPLSFSVEFEPPDPPRRSKVWMIRYRISAPTARATSMEMMVTILSDPPSRFLPRDDFLPLPLPLPDSSIRSSGS